MLHSAPVFTSRQNAHGVFVCRFWSNRLALNRKMTLIQDLIRNILLLIRWNYNNRLRIILLQSRLFTLGQFHTSHLHFQFVLPVFDFTLVFLNSAFVLCQLLVLNINHALLV